MGGNMGVKSSLPPPHKGNNIYSLTAISSPKGASKMDAYLSRPDPGGREAAHRDVQGQGSTYHQFTTRQYECRGNLRKR